MRGNDITMVRIGMSEDVLNQIIAILIARNWDQGKYFSKLFFKGKTYYQSKECVGDQRVLHKHARDNALRSRRLRS